MTVKPPWEWMSVDEVWEALAQPGLRVAILASRERLREPALQARWPESLRAQLQAEHETRGEPGSLETTRLWLGRETPVEVSLCTIPGGASRHNAPTRPDLVTAAVGALASEEAAELRILVLCGSAEEALAHAAAITRALPTYSRKRRATGPGRVRVAFDGYGPASDAQRTTLLTLRDAIANAMHWYDMPAAELGTLDLLRLAEAQARAVGADFRAIVGDELLTDGLRALWAVGRAARQPPALLVLSHRPKGADSAGARSVVWLGKGVVFDSGGLSLKRPHEMRQMKGDMGAAATVLAAFCAAVRLGATDHLHAVLCVAENAIGPDALRPDDILELHCGKTVEVTDTDCEGRLLLADGASYAVAKLSPDVVVDLATLTDGAAIATGVHHAAIVCSDEALERRAIGAGVSCGELVHPLPYAPELARTALTSQVADLTNSAPSQALSVSTAAHFISEGLTTFEGPWLHVDMEATCRTPLGRGTGFGVGLLLRTFGYL